MTAIEETEIYKELCEVYGVRKLGCRGTVKQNIPCEYGNEIWQKCKKEGLECDEKEFHYPLFTTKKQLELIKLIAKSCRGFGLFGYKPVWECGANFSWETFDTAEDDIDFAKALVKLAISLKDELDHAKVKEILEG